MTGEEFTDLYLDSTDLRQYIMDEAKRHSRRPELQEDYAQEAWIRISLCDQGGTLEYYKQQAFRAIQNAYKMEKRKKQYCLEYGETLDRDLWTAWERGYYKKW